MRITESISYRTLLDNISMLNERLQRASEQASSGRKNSQLHDAPANNAEMLQLNRQLSDLDQYQTNADNSGFFIKVTESTLSSVYDVVAAIFSRGSAAASGVNGDVSRAAIASEIRSLRDQLFDLANTQVRGRSLFAGSLVTQPAFAIAGDTITYQGNAEVNTIDIGTNLQVQENVPGSAVLDPVFARVSSLLSAVESGDQAAMQSALGQFSGAFSTISQVRARVGVDLAKLENSESSRQDQQLYIQTRQSHIGDADMAEAIVQLNQTRTALQAALTVGSMVGQKNLFDYIG
jgi:flagellar hook-associated protein 3 FlgL